MANLRDIRRRIKSVKGTAQITKAMQLVAAAKMKKAQDQAVAGRSYAKKLMGVLANLQASAKQTNNPLLQEKDGDKELVLIVTADKGLCGGLNANLQKRIFAEAKDNQEFAIVGKKGVDMLRRLSKQQGEELTILDKFEVNDPVPFEKARPIASFLTEKFLSEEYSAIKVIYTKFNNTMSQEPSMVTLLPIQSEDLSGEEGNASEETDYTFEPNAEEVLEQLLPLYVNFNVYQLIVESRASEHSARMVAMKAATDNANQLTDDLTLEYNKARQAAITAELLEITTAQMAAS